VRAPRPYLRLKFERQRRGLSQQEIADRTRLPQVTISAIENGRTNPSPAELTALSEAFGIHPALLLSQVRVQEENEQVT
jgi:transcriptional regulator with XRE-family HTH domain